MDVNDYFTDPANRDWSALLSDWLWMLPETFTPWLINRFGDVFMVLDDGTVHMLDVGAGQLSLLAPDRNDFCRSIDEARHAREWLLIELVDSLVKENLRLKADECYSFRKFPGLGGDYTKENIHICELSVHYAVSGQIFEKIKDLPEGTRVRFKVR